MASSLRSSYSEVLMSRALHGTEILSTINLSSLRSSLDKREDLDGVLIFQVRDCHPVLP